MEKNAEVGTLLKNAQTIHRLELSNVFTCCFTLVIDMGIGKKSLEDLCNASSDDVLPSKPDDALPPPYSRHAKESTAAVISTYTKEKKSALRRPLWIFIAVLIFLIVIAIIICTAKFARHHPLPRKQNPTSPQRVKKVINDDDAPGYYLDNMFITPMDLTINGACWLNISSVPPTNVSYDSLPVAFGRRQKIQFPIAYESKPPPNFGTVHQYFYSSRDSLLKGLMSIQMSFQDGMPNFRPRGLTIRSPALKKLLQRLKPDTFTPIIHLRYDLTSSDVKFGVASHKSFDKVLASIYEAKPASLKSQIGYYYVKKANVGSYLDVFVELSPEMASYPHDPQAYLKATDCFRESFWNFFRPSETPGYGEQKINPLCLNYLQSHRDAKTLCLPRDMKTVTVAGSLPNISLKDPYDMEEWLSILERFRKELVDDMVVKLEFGHISELFSGMDRYEKSMLAVTSSLKSEVMRALLIKGQPKSAVKMLESIRKSSVRLKEDSYALIEEGTREVSRRLTSDLNANNVADVIFVPQHPILQTHLNLVSELPFAKNIKEVNYLIEVAPFGKGNIRLTLIPLQSAMYPAIFDYSLYHPNQPNLSDFMKDEYNCIWTSGAFTASVSSRVPVTDGGQLHTVSGFYLALPPLSQRYLFFNPYFGKANEALYNVHPTFPIYCYDLDRLERRLPKVDSADFRGLSFSFLYSHDFFKILDKDVFNQEALMNIEYPVPICISDIFLMNGSKKSSLFNDSIWKKDEVMVKRTSSRRPSVDLFPEERLYASQLPPSFDPSNCSLELGLSAKSLLAFNVKKLSYNDNIKYRAQLGTNAKSGCYYFQVSCVVEK